MFSEFGSQADFNKYERKDIHGKGNFLYAS